MLEAALEGNLENLDLDGLDLDSGDEAQSAPMCSVSDANLTNLQQSLEDPIPYGGLSLECTLDDESSETSDQAARLNADLPDTSSEDACEYKSSEGGEDGLDIGHKKE